MQIKQSLNIQYGNTIFFHKKYGYVFKILKTGFLRLLIKNKILSKETI